MVNLTRPPSDSPRPTASGPERRDDLSGQAHRQLIGYIGLLLPILLIVIAGFRPTHHLASWKILESVSAYYYTGAVAAFVGMLVGPGPGSDQANTLNSREIGLQKAEKIRLEAHFRHRK
jgi:hypothetical protein